MGMHRARGAVVVALLFAAWLTIAAPPRSASAQEPVPDQDVFAFGDAGFFGSTGSIALAHPLVGMARTPTDDGYWLVAADGGIFAFGDAGFHGSTGNIRLNQPVVGMAATPTGNGYWLVAADGGIFAFGDATFHGSGVGTVRYQPIVAIAATTTGGGYWLAGSGECSFDGDVTERSFLPESDVMLLTDVRTGDHECYERITFDFRTETGAPNGTISYEIGYASPPFSGPSGIPENVAGNAFLKIVLRGARAHDVTSPTAEPTYTGPMTIQPADLEFVDEMRLIEDFEATLVWVIGLDQSRDFQVFQLDGPDRFVLDIGPPAPETTGPISNVQVFFTPASAIQDDCGAVQGVARTVAGPGLLHGAMTALLHGPTADEQAAGLTSFFWVATAGTLNSVTITNRIARVDFDNFSGIIPNASTSCGSASLLGQLDATATQFDTVDRAVYSFNGDVNAFYNWLQRSPPA